MAKEYWKESRMLDGVRVRKGDEIETAADRILAAEHPDAVTDKYPRTKGGKGDKDAGGGTGSGGGGA